MEHSFSPKAATHPSNDQRKYIRLKSIYPVEFAIVHSPQDVLDLYWRQGYTCNISRGGICLETISLDREALRLLEDKTAYIDLRIGIPLGSPSLKASAQAAWVEHDDGDAPVRCRIGLKFTSITPEDLDRLIRHTRRIQWASSVAAGVSIVLLIGLMVSGVYNYRLRQANESLVEELVETQQEEIKINAASREIIEEGNLVLKQIEQHKGNNGMRQELEHMHKELIDRRERISDRLAILTRKREGLQSSVLEKMHLWLKNHQNPSTGLIMSFEGEVGMIKDWAFIYDQALAAYIFLSLNNDRGARKILNFFNRNAKDDFKGFPNGYYYDSGEVSEFTVHCGPNIWIGIAALQYTHKTGDKYYLPMARKIIDWLITIQDRDPAGGLKGGPEMSWFATEHNLDAYALFHMMYQITSEEKYRIAREKVFSWLKTYAMVSSGNDYKSPPINRGRGDATIATDTYAWSLAALGPDLLKRVGMDPEKIMEFAEEHCAVEVRYRRPSGIKLKVKGFDFAKYAHMPRGGLVSPEWTSQMIVSFYVLSDYFFQKEDFQKREYYQAKADMYLNELNKLIISSPSAKGQGEGCLPYATMENADTGHGWLTPQGASTCSIAGTAYTVMAIKKWNPLALENSGRNIKQGGKEP